MYADFGTYSLENKELAKMDRDLEKITSNLTYDLKVYLKKNLEKIFHYFLNGNPTLTFVVDANIVIQEAVEYTKTKKSALLFMITSCPFLSVIAPSKIQEEVFSKLGELSIDKKIPIEDLEVSLKTILAQIKFQEPDAISQIKAHELIDSKDLKDADYIALHFSENSDGILTKDKHITELSEIKTWSVRDMGRVLTRVENGTFSVVVVGNVLPAMLHVLYELAVFILKTLFEISIMLLSLVTKILSTPIAIWLLVALAIYSYAEGTLEENVKKIVGFVEAALSKLSSAVKSLLEFIAGMLNIGVEQVRILFISISTTLATYHSLRTSKN